jgi:hypothetical protein
MGSYKEYNEEKFEGIVVYYITSPEMDCRSYIRICYRILSLIEQEQRLSNYTRARELEVLKTVYHNDLEDCLDWISQEDD